MDGRTVGEATFEVPADLPLGYHRVRASSGRRGASAPLIVTPAFLDLARRTGLSVQVWTVNDPADMERLLDMGVDGLITDRADLLKDVLQRRGQWPPDPQ